MSCPYLASLDEEARELALSSSYLQAHGQHHSANAGAESTSTTTRNRNYMASSLSSVDLSSEDSRLSTSSSRTSTSSDGATPSSSPHSSPLPQLGLKSGSRQLQFWELTRPNLEFCPKLKRRELRKLGRTFSLAEVREHRYKDDCWIAVDGSVYDITEHLVDHPGWDTGAGVSTVLSILAHAGSECSAEFHQIHAPYPKTYSQLRAYYIGELAME